jgi:2-polyprenyl-6-methoxyphenol hydroxylase-like FAD-dependent oxidoreductase
MALASIIVCGGGIVGLCSAMMLARDGHQVTVLESDADPAPETPGRAWEAWTRRGVAQFRQPHSLFTRSRQVLDTELPGLTDRLAAAGCVWVDFLDSLPPTLSDTAPRPGDEAFRFVTGRRPVIETVMAAASAEQPGLTIRRGVRVAGLLAGSPAIAGVPHVAGVRTEAGEEIRADLVVDAMGRRSPVRRWLTELGARDPFVESEDKGFVYYTRYFTGPNRPRRIGPALAPMGSISLLTLDSDNDTWSVTLFATTGDKPLKALRNPEVFSRVVAACPLQAHWLDGQPITDVLAMAGVIDRYQRFVVDGVPVATGFAAIGDAWSCTNPSAGRGMSVGLVHAQELRAVVADTLADPAKFALAFDERTEAVVAPFYRNQVAADRARIAQMTAIRDGREPPRSESIMARFVAAAAYDPDLFRGLIETVLCMALPQEVLERPGIKDKIEQYGDAEPPAMPGPDRGELLRLLAA